MSGREKRIGGPREPLCEDNLIWVQTPYNMCGGKGFVEKTYAGSLLVQLKTIYTFVIITCLRLEKDVVRITYFRSCIILAVTLKYQH